MAGQRKSSALRDVLTARAERELGEGATALDYLCLHLGGGGMLNDLLPALAEELGEPISRQLLSHVAQRLADDAPERLRAARREGASALVETAVEILDNAPTGSREELTKAKSRSDVRLWIAERANPAEYGSSTRITGQISLGVAHIDALRQRSIVDATIVASDIAASLPAPVSDESPDWQLDAGE